MQHALRKYLVHAEGLYKLWGFELLDRVRYIIQQKADTSLDCVLNDIAVHVVAKPTIPW